MMPAMNATFTNESFPSLRAAVRMHQRVMPLLELGVGRDSRAPERLGHAAPVDVRAAGAEVFDDLDHLLDGRAGIERLEPILLQGLLPRRATPNLAKVAPARL